VAIAAQVLRVDRNEIDDQPDENAAKLSPEDRDFIGERLREMYQALTAEPLSPRLRDVLERLAQSEGE